MKNKKKLLTDGFVIHRRIWSDVGPRYVGLYRPGKQLGVPIFILSAADGYIDIVMAPAADTALVNSSSSFNALAASNGVGE